MTVCPQLLLHIGTHVLASHVGKITELKFFGASNVAVSEAHKNLGEWHHFFGSIH